jgi:hypothetical protein
MTHLSPNPARIDNNAQNCLTCALAKDAKAVTITPSKGGRLPCFDPIPKKKKEEIRSLDDSMVDNHYSFQKSKNNNKIEEKGRL